MYNFRLVFYILSKSNNNCVENMSSLRLKEFKTGKSILALFICHDAAVHNQLGEC